MIRADEVGGGVGDRVEWPAGRDRDAALIIRTDYGDERAWAAVRAELMRDWGDGEFTPYVHLVDDPEVGGPHPGSASLLGTR
ncbi:DUF6924 domain-containing protein [Streptomyces sp. NPDC002308]